jgi:hypothetical protein
MNSDLKRKGARRIADIPPPILEQLNLGKIESANLMECLALDLKILLKKTFPTLPDSLLNAVEGSWLVKTRLIPQILYDHFGAPVLDQLKDHPSDNVRGWGAGVISYIPGLSIEERLERVRFLADDPHSGVREVAWLFIRPHIADNLQQSIRYLESWVHDLSPHIRRYAIEITRPRGVWCSHIEELKQNPQMGLCLLEPLKSDSSRYV